MKLEEIIQRVADGMELPYDVCYKAYMSAWKFPLIKIQELPLHEDMPIEEFKKLRVNFNMPSLGKLYITPENFERKNRKLKIIHKYRQAKLERENAENQKD